MDIEINPRKAFITLLIIISFLLFFNIIAVTTRYVFHLYDFNVVKAIFNLFSFNMERNFPSLYSGLALFTSSLLLLIIAIIRKSRGSDYLAWFGLMLVFFFLSFDEIASIHEKMSPLLRQTLNTTGALYYAWIIPYGILSAAFVAVYIPFLLKLPKRIMILFIVSGTIFISGALGFEMLGGWIHSRGGNDDNLLYAVVYTFEELLEMLGIALFIYTLVTYIVDQCNHFTITISPSNPR